MQAAAESTDSEAELHLQDRDVSMEDAARSTDSEPNLQVRVEPMVSKTYFP